MFLLPKDIKRTGEFDKLAWASLVAENEARVDGQFGF
jgi:hypothetical protein